MLSALGEIRKDECKEREDALEKARRKEYSGAVLLRIRGFLHALRLVEMTVHFYHHNHGLPCISSITCDCISSTLVVVYHHAVACMRCPFQEILRVFQPSD